MRKLSYNARRILLAVIWVPTTVALVNHVLGLNWFGAYERDVVPISLVLLVVGVLFIGPSLEEMRERNKKRKQRSDSHSE